MYTRICPSEIETKAVRGAVMYKFMLLTTLQLRACLEAFIYFGLIYMYSGNIFVLFFQIDLEKSWSFTDPEELKKLREQNENLMTVIKEMRLQMEELSQELPAPDEEKKSKKDGPNNNGINAFVLIGSRNAYK